MDCTMVLIVQYMDFPMAKELLIHLNPYSADIICKHLPSLTGDSSLFGMLVQ